MKKKDIIQLVKKIVKEGAYGSATLTTQGATRTRAVAPAGKDPYTGRVEYPYTVGAKTKNGMMENESTSFKVVNADTGKTIDFGLDQAKAEEIVALAKEDNINAKVVKMKGEDDVGTLNEFTSMGQEGTYPRREEPGDMFQQKEVEELLPFGMASRDDSAFQDRLKKHADWTEESGYNNTFVHIQYHDSFDREHSYRIHQSQNYNGNYPWKDGREDFRNPKFTVLNITKIKEGKEENLGRYIVDTDAYLKDFAKLRNDGVLGKQVSENKKNKMKKKIKETTFVGKKQDTFIKAKDTTSYQQADSITKQTIQDKLKDGESVELNEKPTLRTTTSDTMPNEDIQALERIIQRTISKKDKPAAYSIEKVLNTIALLSDNQQIADLVPQLNKKKMDIKEMINDYINKRGDDSLKEQVDKHRKRATLMEGATEKLFKLFNIGKTDAEVRSIYLQQNIDMPEAFISKLRNNWEALRKTKLDLTLADKEAEGFESIQAVKSISGMEGGGEGMEEEKQLASGLFNEIK